ncbi:MAG TPA: hypothetical protein PLU72_18165 [Candidatus Ozemobacteraceae bacterium]|nr:hypothetical protein [Candidatus Ozemobacteraceae bacterium]
MSPRILLALVLILATAAGVPAQEGAAAQDRWDQVFISGPIQRIGDSIVNPHLEQEPVPTDIDRILSSVRTGDIIIENNLAFPQIYAVFGTLMPNTRFVHAGVVVSGRELDAELRKLTGRVGDRRMPRPLGLKTVVLSAAAGGRRVKSWEAMPAIDPAGWYVVSSEFSRIRGDSYVFAMQLGDYLRFPSGAYCTKVMKVLRPRGLDEAKRRLVAAYLAYHVYRLSPYDKRFSLAEAETGIRRNEQGQIFYRLSTLQVPLYCTEIVHRALRFAGLPGADLASPLGNVETRPVDPPQKDWWRLPVTTGVSFAVADGFMRYADVIYENGEPFSVDEARRRASLLKPIHHEWQRTCATLRTLLKLP